MWYLVEKLNTEGKTTLGTEGRHIFKHYNSLLSLERYQIKRLVKRYGKLLVSEYYADSIHFYGKPLRVWKYENSETNSKGFWKCIMAEEQKTRVFSNRRK